ncbi:MAG: sigma-54 interaction domain-containing protein [Aminipila sp.]
MDEGTSSMYRAMRYGVPIYVESQDLKAVGRNSIKIASLSTPIKSAGKIVGAIDLSCSVVVNDDEEAIELSEELVDAIDAMKSMEAFQTESGLHYTIDDIVTGNHKMLEMKKLIKKAGACDLPVMIYGETGTGKELVAQSIHSLSDRAEKPFVAQNCAAIPDTLLESILFGTSKGAFTGAIDNVGLFELADGGTLFLDEINSMSVNLQAKLLRVLQDGTFRKVGSHNLQKVNLRIITATNEDPVKIVKQGTLRQDIYYRLSVFNINIPPLRERKDDVPLLVTFFISKYNKALNKDIHFISNKLYKTLQNYSWPGNVRELESLIAYGAGVAEDNSLCLEFMDVKSKLELMELPVSGELEKDSNEPGRLSDLYGLKTAEKPYEVTGESGTLADIVCEYEKQLIKKALNENDNNISQAAKLLGIPRQTLSRKVKEYRILQC